MQHPDICIVGAGIIGLSLALELRHRGYLVTVIDRGDALREASTAAAGMLAADDPENPPPLHALANLSLSLYPSFLERIHSLSPLRVDFQTHTTLQALPAHLQFSQNELSAEELAHVLPSLHPKGRRFALLKESSIDPRQLAPALLDAVRETAIDLRLNDRVLSVDSAGGDCKIRTAYGTCSAAKWIDCTGAWATSTSLRSNLPVYPKKGQMVAVELPSSLALDLVVRTEDVYIVPRTRGIHAGRAIIGATVEDAGFDKTVDARSIAGLRALAAALLPPLASAAQLESWAGLRPATSDGLPLLGPLRTEPHHLLATGHFRNGILLAPATALVMAQLLSGESPAVDLVSFSPDRMPAQST